MNVMGFEIRINAHANRTIDEVEIFGPSKCPPETVDSIVEYLRSEGFVNGNVGTINYSALL